MVNFGLALLVRPRENSCSTLLLVMLALRDHGEGQTWAMLARPLGTQWFRDVLSHRCVRLKIPSFGLRAPPVRRRRS